MTADHTLEARYLKALTITAPTENVALGQDYKGTASLIKVTGLLSSDTESTMIDKSAAVITAASYKKDTAKVGDTFDTSVTGVKLTTAGAKKYYIDKYEIYTDEQSRVEMLKRWRNVCFIFICIVPINIFNSLRIMDTSDAGYIGVGSMLACVLVLGMFIAGIFSINRMIKGQKNSRPYPMKFFIIMLLLLLAAIFAAAGLYMPPLVAL